MLIKRGQIFIVPFFLSFFLLFFSRMLAVMEASYRNNNQPCSLTISRPWEGKCLNLRLPLAGSAQEIMHG